MGPTSKRRRSDSEAGQQGSDELRGQEGALLEGGTAAAAAGASAGNGQGAAAAGAHGSHTGTKTKHQQSLVMSILQQTFERQRLPDTARGE